MATHDTKAPSLNRFLIARGMGTRMFTPIMATEHENPPELPFGRIVPSRTRMLAALVASASMLLYGLAGHGLHDQTAGHGVSSVAAGVCLLLVTVLGCIAMPKPEEFRTSLVVVLGPARESPPESPAADRRARASPISLQRFRN